MLAPSARVSGAVVAVLLAGQTTFDAVTPRTGQRTSLIVGIVVDATSGKPISGAIVSISSGIPLRGSPAPLPRFLTGSDGRFVYRDLPRGNYNITAQKPGYLDGAHGRRRPADLSVALTLDEREQTDDVVIRLWKHAVITGTVLDEAGEPVVGARVRSWRRSFDRGRYVFLNAAAGVTDDRGVYRLGGLIPGEYIIAVPALQVSVRRDAGGFSIPPDRAAASAAKATVMRLDPMLSVGVQGSPTPPPPVDGQLSLYPTIWHPSATELAQAAPISMASGQEPSGVDLQLHPVPTVRVSGSIARADGRVNAIPIALVAAGEDIQHDGFRTASDGISIRGVVPGGYRVGVAGMRTPVGRWWLKSIVSSGRDLLDRPIDVRQGLSDVVVPFSEDAGLLYGRIDGAEAARLANGHVIVFGSDKNTWFYHSRRIAAARPDADGQYSIRNLPAGQYFIAFDDNVDANEWFDPIVLDRLVPRALRLTLAQDERRNQGLSIK